MDEIVRHETTFSRFVAPPFEATRPRFFVPRSEVPSTVLTAEADTMGWDTVNALRLPLVNSALESSRSWPETFEYSPQSDWLTEGTFGTWSLVRGGSGSILFMETQIQSALMRFTGIPDLELGSGKLWISLKLHYLPQAPQPKARATTQSDEGQYLVRRTTPASADVPAVVIQGVDYGGVVPNDVQDALFRAAMQGWFNEHLDRFTHVFAVVNLNSKAAVEQFQWLKPTYTSYAYLNGSTDETSFLGILNMTQNHDPSGLPNQVAAAAIPAGVDGSLLISNGSFLRNMVLPGLARSFEHAVEGAFTIEKGPLIVNKQPVRLGEIEAEGKRYSPELLDFKLQIVGDELVIHTFTKITVSPGIDVFVTADEYYRIELVQKPDGGQTLDFKRSRDPERTSRVEKALWVTITEVIVSIIGAVIAIVATSVIGPLALAIVAVVIIGLVAGLAAAIPSLIALVMEGKAAEALPSIGDMVFESTDEIEWPGAAGFVLKTAELNGSLQLGGDLTEQPTSLSAASLEV